MSPHTLLDGRGSLDCDNTLNRSSTSDKDGTFKSSSIHEGNGTVPVIAFSNLVISSHPALTIRQEKPLDFEEQLQVFKAVSRFLPDKDENQSFWWKITGRHVARMMHEAGY